MNKFHIVIVVLVAGLVTLVGALAFYTDEAKTYLGGLGGGLGQTVVDMSSGFNSFLSTYEPYQVLGAGSIGGILLTMFLANWLWPRIQERRQIQPLTDPLQRGIVPTAPTVVQKVEEPAK